MIMEAVGAIGSLAGAAYGAIASANYNRKARTLLNKQQDENRRWYQTKMAEDYTNRTDAQAVINKQNEILKAQNKRAMATTAVAGGTPEQEAMQKASANNALAQTSADIASQAASYKDNVENAYRQSEQNYTNQQAQTMQAQAQATAQAAGQAVNAGVNLLGNSIANKKVAQP